MRLQGWRIQSRQQKTHNDNARRVYAPIRSVCANSRDHARKIGLGIGIGNIAGRTRHVIECERLVASLQKSQGGWLLLVHPHMREASTAADNRRRPTRVLMLWHGVCQIRRKRRGMLLRDLVSPKGKLLDDHYAVHLSLLLIGH